jgi:hypothetical protein
LIWAAALPAHDDDGCLDLSEKKDNGGCLQ